MRVILVLLVFFVSIIGKNGGVQGFKDWFFTEDSGIENYLGVYQGLLDQLKNPTLESRDLSRKGQEEVLNPPTNLVWDIIKTVGLSTGMKATLSTLQMQTLGVINLSLLLRAEFESTFQVFQMLKDAEFAMEECTNRFPTISADFELLQTDAEKLDALTKRYLSSTQSAAEDFRRKIVDVANQMSIQLGFVKDEIGACEIRLKNTITTVASAKDSEGVHAVLNAVGGTGTGLLVYTYADDMPTELVFIGTAISIAFFIVAALKVGNVYCSDQLLGHLRGALKEVNGFHQEARKILVQITDARSRYEDEL